MPRLRIAALAAAGLLLGSLAGCRQDMHNQPRYRPLRSSSFFGDARASRPLVPGTVARGQLRDDPAFYDGKVNGQPVAFFPVEVTRATLERGRERFDIYCAPCHSRTGDGDGMIVRRGYLRPPSFHIDRLRQAPPGHFYTVITNGLGGMPDYAQQIAPADRWAIVAYIRALQLSQNAPLSDVPASEQPKLDLPLAAPESVTGRTGVHGQEPPVRDAERQETQPRGVPFDPGKKEEKKP